MPCPPYTLRQTDEEIVLLVKIGGLNKNALRHTYDNDKYSISFHYERKTYDLNLYFPEPINSTSPMYKVECTAKNFTVTLKKAVPGKWDQLPSDKPLKKLKEPSSKSSASSSPAMEESASLTQDLSGAGTADDKEDGDQDGDQDAADGAEEEADGGGAGGEGGASKKKKKKKNKKAKAAEEALQTPPIVARQNDVSVIMLVQVPDIDEASVKLTVTGSQFTLRFSTKESAEAYELKRDLGKELDPNTTRTAMATRNMALILSKKTAEPFPNLQFVPESSGAGMDTRPIAQAGAATNAEDTEAAKAKKRKEVEEAVAKERAERTAKDAAKAKQDQEKEQQEAAAKKKAAKQEAAKQEAAKQEEAKQEAAKADQKVAEDSAARRKAEAEAALQQAEEEAAQRRRELEAAIRQADEEAAKKKAAAEAAIKQAEQEEAAMKASAQRQAADQKKAAEKAEKAAQETAQQEALKAHQRREQQIAEELTGRVDQAPSAVGGLEVRLHDLNLTDAQLPQRLPRHLALAQVSLLSLSGNCLTDGSIAVLERAFAACHSSGHSSVQLTELDLSCNRITSSGAGELKSLLQQGSTGVTSLDLSFNHLGSETVSMLGLQDCSVEHLNLCGNNLTDAGAMEMARLFSKGILLDVDLSNTSMGPMGAKVLANALKEPKVHFPASLRLDDNCIGDKGAQAFADAMRDSGCRRLRMLSMRNISMTDLGAEALAAAVAMLSSSSVLRELCLQHNPALTISGTAKLVGAGKAKPRITIHV